MLQAILKNRHWIVLVAILVLGLFLRTYCLTCESVWLDEGYSVLWAKQPPAEMIEAVSKDVHPPLYFLVLHYWIALFGEAEFTIRFLSVMFGFLAIFMMYKVGRLLFDRDSGLLASLILSLSTFHIHFSQELRGYSLMVLLALSSMYFFIKLLKEGRHVNYIAYVASGILLLYTHYFGLFVILAQNIYFLAYFMSSNKGKRLCLKKWVLLQASLFLLYLPWIGFLIRQTSVVQAGHFLGWVPVPSPLSIIMTLYEYSGYYGPSAPMWVLISSAVLLVLYLGLSAKPLLGFHGLSLKSCWAKIRKNSLLLTWFFVPIITPLIISHLLAPIYWTRFTIPASLALYLLVAKGIKTLKSRSMRLSIITLIIILSLINTWGMYSVTDNEQWRETANYIETNAKEGDLVLINAWYCHIPFDYYFKSDVIHRDVFPKWDMVVDTDNINSLPSVIQDYDRIWIVLSHDGDPQGLIEKTLKELLYEQVPGKSLHGIELYLFEKQS